jgi:hypothetical protein
MAGFPLAALLPDLWTVYVGLRPVSQHATMRLATLHMHRLEEAGETAYISIRPPEHSPVVVAMARQAIRRAMAR